MAYVYKTFNVPQHGGGPDRPVNTSVRHSISGSNNIPVSVYNCGPCVASCLDINLRLQRRVTSAVWETVGSRLNREICDSRKSSRLDETFSAVRKSGATMQVLFQLDGRTHSFGNFYHQ